MAKVKINWKKVFIKDEDWAKLVMELPRLKVEYTTQFWKMDGVTLTWMALAFMIGLVIGVNIA